MKPEPDRKEGIEGVVTARTCDCCGHHEIGVVTLKGEYLPLKPGMRVIIAALSNHGSSTKKGAAK